MLKTSAAKLWLLLHVLFPMLPFGCEAVLRSLLTCSLSFETVSASNLAMSLSLLALFVSQSLANPGIPLRVGDRADALRLRVFAFLLIAFLFFGLFVLLVEAQASSAGAYSGGGRVAVLSWLAVLSAPLPVVMAFRARSEFKLKVAV